jgi:hypothetical protein
VVAPIRGEAPGFGEMTRSRWFVPAVCAALAFFVHLALNPGYGFFRDELYFIMCGRHPSFGYVDEPPLAPLLAAASQAFGMSLIALHGVAALFSAASVFVTCLIVQEFEGGAFAQFFAAIVAFLTPVLMSFGSKISTDTIGMWLWPLAVLYLIRLVKGGDARNWLGAGAALGVSGEAKYSVLFFTAALFAGLLLTPERRIMRTPWCVAGFVLLSVIWLPSFVWQAAHGFPMLELLRNGQMGKNVILSPAQFLLQQLFLLNPLLTLIPIAGFVWLIVQRQWRWLAFSYAILIAMMIVMHGKDYYPADVYPYLIAAGAIPIEQWTRRSAAILQPAAIVLAVAAGSWTVPFVLPVLPEQQLVAYRSGVFAALHVAPNESEHHRPAAMGQDYADEHGWPQLAATVARVYLSLPPRDRARTAIVASNYGEAAAIDFFGAQYGLPPALSGHNQYFLWGTRGYTGDVLIDVNGDCGAKEHLFLQSRKAAVFSAPYVMPYENDLPIMLCRGIKKPLAEIWPAVKDYN